MYKWDIENAYATKSGKYKTKISSNFINRYINTSVQRQKILDIGGGSGRFAIPLSDSGHDVTVIDPNEEALIKLRTRNKKIKLINSSFESVEHCDKYDVILLMEVLGNT